jgi:hypothetical protein
MAQRVTDFRRTQKPPAPVRPSSHLSAPMSPSNAHSTEKVHSAATIADKPMGHSLGHLTLSESHSSNNSNNSTGLINNHSNVARPASPSAITAVPNPSPHMAPLTLEQKITTPKESPSVSGGPRGSAVPLLSPSVISSSLPPAEKTSEGHGSSPFKVNFGQLKKLGTKSALDETNELTEKEKEENKRKADVAAEKKTCRRS